jgi:hypothetical protein
VNKSAPLVIKMLQIGAGLIGDSRSIGSYFATRHQAPLQLGLPWISFGAIRFLEKFLRPSMQVFEYGSGGSTVFFASRCQSVVSVEDSPEWVKLVRDSLNGAKNANVIFRPTEKITYERDGLPIDTINFSASDYLHAINGLTPDVVMIDGQDDWALKLRRRAICFRHVEPIMKPGNIIIVDDAFAYPELRAENRAKYIKTFWGLGPCRTGATSTDIFFY